MKTWSNQDDDIWSTLCEQMNICKILIDYIWKCLTAADKDLDLSIKNGYTLCLEIHFVHPSLQHY